MIDNFHRGRGYFLTNYYPAPIVSDGIVYPSVEHAYQAIKSLDQEQRRFIAKLESPADAKKYARRHVNLRPDWKQVKNEVMLRLLRLKFAPGSGMATLLLETGFEVLVEGNDWHDNYWGVCRCERCRMTEIGHNVLGALLEQVRYDLRQAGIDGWGDEVEA